MDRNVHVPERRCIACKQVHPQGDMIRIVCMPEGLRPYEKGLSGRSCYICRNEECIRTAFEKNCFAKSLRHEVPRIMLAELEKQLKTKY